LKQSVVTVAGISSPILSAGDASSSDAVVFVHGNPGSSADWKGLLHHVAPFSRALAMDMPGFGKAGKPADFDYTVNGYARHLGELLDSERVERAHLVLHDFGGPWGLAWAVANLDRTLSVTLFNIGVMPGYRWHYMARIWRTPLLGEVAMAATTRAGLKLSLRYGNPRGLPDDYVDEMFANFDAGTRRAVLRLYRSTGDVGGMSERFGATLSARRLPALVVWGTQDPYVPASYAEVQREYFDVNRVVRLEDSGHWPMIDNPAAVREIVVPFLREQTARARPLGGSQAAARPDPRVQ
jgi:pimeloyl-ACP methyl ester carboxylesterase